MQSIEASTEATLCFVRAMLVGVDEEQEVPEDLLSRVGELLRLDRNELTGEAISPARPMPRFAVAPSTETRHVLVVGRADAARMPMLEAIVRAHFDSPSGERIEVRGAAITPVPIDPRALKVLRHAGVPVEGGPRRPLSVDDLAWAHIVLTTGGERGEWERYLPRSLMHEHVVLDDPIALARGLRPEDDELEPFRHVLRLIERGVSALLSDRPSASIRLSSTSSMSRLSVAAPIGEPPSPAGAPRTPRDGGPR